MRFVCLQKKERWGPSDISPVLLADEIVFITLTQTVVALRPTDSSVASAPCVRHQEALACADVVKALHFNDDGAEEEKADGFCGRQRA